MAKLVTIGDSVTQGFQSGAIYKTVWSYPAIIARTLGLSIPRDFRVPRFPGSGLPLNIERLLRWMRRELGPDINPLEWVAEFPFLLDEFFDQVEDIYERGSGARPATSSGAYHNLAVWGFQVNDSYTITSEYCDRAIKRREGWIEDDFLGLPSAPMYRTARRVLNPRFQTTRRKWTQVDNLRHIARDDGGVENLILYLGNNDCLGTVLDLELRDMESSNVTDDPIERRRWNLTHPDVFKRDFEKLVERVTAVIQKDTNVFVGTMPHVVILPVTQGIPPLEDGYFEYYVRFFINADNFNPILHKKLTRDEAKLIDGRIDQFNTTIRSIIATPKKGNWQIVDIGKVIDDLAVRRKGLDHDPGRPLREFYEHRDRRDHPLLRLDPVPSILRLGTGEHGRRYRGGLASLDGAHPTTISYGIIAEEFLTEMQKVGVGGTDPAKLNWQEIIYQDTLLQQPPVLWDDIVEAGERYPTLWDALFRVFS